MPRRAGVHGIGLVSTITSDGASTIPRVGWWDPNQDIGCTVGAWQGKGALNYNASKMDLTGNGNNLTEGFGAVPWAAVSGWSFVAAATQYFDCGAGVQPVSGWTLIVQFANVMVNGWFCGANPAGGANDNISIGSNATGAASWIAYGPVNFGGAASGGAGNLCVVPLLGYLNGAADGAIGAYGVAGVPCNLYIGDFNAGGAPSGGYTTADIYAVAAYNCVLTAPQIAVVAAAMAAL